MNAKKYDLATSHKNWKKFPAVSSDIITHHSSDKVSKVWFIELLPSIQRNDFFSYVSFIERFFAAIAKWRNQRALILRKNWAKWWAFN